MALSQKKVKVIILWEAWMLIIRYSRACQSLNGLMKPEKISEIKISFTNWYKYLHQIQHQPA